MFGLVCLTNPCSFDIQGLDVGLTTASKEAQLQARL